MRPCADIVRCMDVASSPGHSQILSHSHGEKSGEGLGSLLRHGPEMVDSVSIIESYVLTKSISGLRRSNDPRPSPDFLHGCEIKSGSGLATRLVHGLVLPTSSR